MAQFNLDHGMSVYVNDTQYSDRLEMSVWFNNPKNFQYWKTPGHESTGACLTFASGTPAIQEYSDSLPDCDFFTTAPDCIKSPIPLNPRATTSPLVSRYDCGIWRPDILYGKANTYNNEILLKIVFSDSDPLIYFYRCN